MQKKEVLQFQDKIFSWWSQNRREFPWRKTTDPYQIMVSEFQLQQTQANRVVPKYLQFIRKFPNIDDLAQSATADVIREWQGLGYNRRAIWLKEAAETIVEMGYFPREPNELLKIRGIGPYTSRSIPIFAFNSNFAAVDTNIRRILIVEGFVMEDNSKKQVQEIAEQLLPYNRSRDWHNALMDYGAILITAKKTGIKPRTTQSKFEGSKRQIRGKLVKILAQENELKLDNITRKLNIDEEIVKRVLDDLIRDGLIQKSESKYSLVD